MHTGGTQKPNEEGIEMKTSNILAAAALSLRGVELFTFGSLTIDRRPEVADPVAKLAPNFRQLLRPENEQRDHQHEEQVCGLHDVADH